MHTLYILKRYSIQLRIEYFVIKSIRIFFTHQLSFLFFSQLHLLIIIILFPQPRILLLQLLMQFQFTLIPITFTSLSKHSQSISMQAHNRWFQLRQSHFTSLRIMRPCQHRCDSTCTTNRFYPLLLYIPLNLQYLLRHLRIMPHQIVLSFILRQFSLIQWPLLFSKRM